MGAILCPRKNRRSVDEYTGTSRSDQTLVGVGCGRRAGTRPIASSGLPRVARHSARLHGGRACPDHTLQASALVNEVYLKLVDVRQMKWQNRAHFFGVSAQLMRRILVDFARRRHYLKRGGGVRPVTLNEGLDMSAAKTTDLVALDDALNALADVDPRKVRVVELRFFAGLTVEETAEVLKVSLDTVARDWRLAKVWLHEELQKGGA